MKRLLFALVLALPLSVQATQPWSAMYLESGDHCEEVWPDYIDVKVMMDMQSPGNISIWRCFIDYWDAYWVPVSATLGADMPPGSALVTNFAVDPNYIPPNYGSDSFVLLGLTPTSNPIPAGNGKHVATVRMNRTGYPAIYGCTALKFNGHLNTTDWTDVTGDWLWGYGWPYTTLLNAKWKLRDDECGYVSDCPTDSWSPCPHCPPELSEKVTGPDTAIQTKTWNTVKGLYR